MGGGQRFVRHHRREETDELSAARRDERGRSGFSRALVVVPALALGVAGLAVGPAGAALRPHALGTLKVPCSSPNPAGGGPRGLQHTITAANMAGGGTIILGGRCVYSFVDPSAGTVGSPAGPAALPAITAPITIVGQGATIVRNSGVRFRLINIDQDGSLAARGLTIRGGFDNSGLGGGAIYNSGNLALRNTTITNNGTTSLGGGIFSGPGSTSSLAILAGNITQNTAALGGGIFAFGSVTTGAFQGTPASISANTATTVGGAGIWGAPGSLLLLSQASITGNKSTGAPGNGGGIWAAGPTLLSNSTVSGNTADVGGGVFIEGNDVFNVNRSTISSNTAANGGGIVTPTPLGSITNSTISSNTTSLQAGGVLNLGTLALTRVNVNGNSTAGSGAGILNQGTLSYAGGSLGSNHSGGSGGGLFNAGTVQLLDQVTVSSNSASSDGGGIENQGGGTISTISNSTFNNNSAGNGGGIDNSGTVDSLFNSTFASNSASGSGGAINNASGFPSVTSVTLSGNSAATGGGIDNAGTVVLAASIVANSPGGDCVGTAAVTDGGYNLASDATCHFTAGTSHNSSAIGSFLGPLAANGGPTKTIALLPGGNPALKAITVTCSSVLVSATDQRGITRPGTDCDIGPYQTITTTTTLMSSPLSPATVPIDTPVTLTATVSPQTSVNGFPGGSVTFVANGSQDLGTVALSGGNPDQAVLVTTGLGLGSNSIVALYDIASVGFATSESTNPVTVTVNP